MRKFRIVFFISNHDIFLVIFVVLSFLSMFISHVSKLLYLNYFKLLSTAFMLNIPWTRHLFSAATVNFENYLTFCIILQHIMTCITLLCAGEALTQSDLDKLKKLEIHRILKCLQNEVSSEEVLS